MIIFYQSNKKQNKTEIYVRFLGSCCDRPCYLLFIDCGRALKPWAGKAIEHSELNVLQLWVLGKYAESSKDDGGLTSDISGGKDCTRAVCVLFSIKKLWLWSVGLKNQQLLRRILPYKLYWRN